MDNYVFLLTDIHRLKYFYFFKNHKNRAKEIKKRKKCEKKRKRRERKRRGKEKKKGVKKSDRPTFSIGLKDS